jgi:hypothetical protein
MEAEAVANGYEHGARKDYFFVRIIIDDSYKINDNEQNGTPATTA